MIILLNTHCEKPWRFSLGVKLEQMVYDLITGLIMAKNAPKAMKAPYLLKADSQLEVIQLTLRLYVDLDVANKTQIFQINAVTQDIGNMLGGWLRSVQ